MTIRLGILGATRGLNFALAAVEHKLDLEVAAVCDYFPPLLEKVKANLPENSFSPAYYTDFSDMIQNTPLDAVVIANNANEHARYAIEALEHGLHVLSEVLPVQTPAEAVALCEAVEKSGKKYFYAENYCYMRPNFEAALRYRRGEIGTIVEGECDFVNDCSQRWHLLTRGQRDHWRNFVPSTFYCTHSIGPMIYALQDRVETVTGFEVPCLDYMREHGARSGSAAMEVMKLKNGALLKSVHGNLKRSWVTRMRLTGTKGTLETQNGQISMNLENEAKNGYDVQTPDYTQILNLSNDVMNRFDPFQLACVIAAMNGDSEAEKWCIDVYMALDMAMPGLFAYRSILAGNIPLAVPDFRLPEVREAYRNDHSCTDAKIASGADLLPSCSMEDVQIPESVYEREQALLYESLEKNFKLGMN